MVASGDNSLRWVAGDRALRSYSRRGHLRTLQCRSSFSAGSFWRCRGALWAGTGKDATAKHCRRDDESGQTADVFVFHMWFVLVFPVAGCGGRFIEGWRPTRSVSVVLAMDALGAAESGRYVNQWRLSRALLLSYTSCVPACDCAPKTHASHG